MNDIERPMLLYYVIYYERFKNVLQRAEKVALNWLTCHEPVSSQGHHPVYLSQH